MQNQNPENPVSRIGAKIDLKTATKWTRYSRQRHPNETISHLFGRDIIDKILSQQDCAGLRIYYANSKPLTNINSAADPDLDQLFAHCCRNYWRRSFNYNRYKQCRR